MQGIKGLRTQEIKLETEENSREGNDGRTERRDKSRDTLASDTS